MNSSPKPTAAPTDPYTADAYAAYWHTVESNPPSIDRRPADRPALRDAYAEFCDHADL
jgi:hypothetical protein